ncbi:MAG: hypothetical protein J6Y16_11310 [Treponema sp.]|nr:hypothetical protein [Treponema sp.]
MTEDHSYELALQGIRDLGQCGASVCTAVSSLGASAFDATGKIVQTVFSPITNAIDTYKTIKIQKLQNELRKEEMAHEQKILKHEEKMLKERNRHEEFIISEQRKVIEKLIKSANQTFKEKVDFLKSQLNCLQQVYTRESELLSEHINYLETEMSKSFNDANKYLMLSKDLNKLEDRKSKLEENYNTAQGKLTEAIGYLEIDKAFSNSMRLTQNNILGIGGKTCQ